MTRGAAAGLALLGCGVLLLASTQPWAATVTEVAPGAPRTRGDATSAELVPWLAPVALVTALAVLAALSGMGWGRWVAAVASLAVLGGAALAVNVVVTTSGSLGAAHVVSVAPTAWLWVAATGALVAALGALAGGLRRPSGRGRARTEASDDAEAERRRDAARWRDLSEGRDPTEPGPADHPDP